MYKKLGIIILAALLFMGLFITPAKAGTYDMFTGFPGGVTTLNVSGTYTNYVQVNNNTASPITARVRIFLPQGVFRNGSTTGTGYTGALTCWDYGFRERHCETTFPAFSTVYLNTPVVARVCLPASSTLETLLYQGTYPTAYVTLTAAAMTVTGGTGRVACTLSITDPPNPYPVWTAENRNTGYDEEVWFSIAYAAPTSGFVRYGVTNSGKATIDQFLPGLYDLSFRYDPGNVWVTWCGVDASHTWGDCIWSGWQSGKTGRVNVYYHTGNIAGFDKKFMRFYQNGTLQFEQLIPVTVT